MAKKKYTSKEELPPVMHVADVQAFLSIGKMQAYEVCDGKNFHVTKVGKRYLIDKDNFIRWFTNGQSSESNIAEAN